MNPRQVLRARTVSVAVAGVLMATLGLQSADALGSAAGHSRATGSARPTALSDGDAAPDAGAAPSRPTVSAAAGHGRPADSVAPAATAGRDGDASTARSATLSATEAVGPGCDLLGVRLTELNDRVWVTWDAVSGATQHQVYRQREAGSWVSLGILPGSTTSKLDAGVNVDGFYTYRVWVWQGTTKTYCDTELSSMQTNDGWGVPDVVSGSDSGLVQQNEYSGGYGFGSGSMVDPSFSADGRLIAASVAPADGTSDPWRVQVLNANRRTVVTTVTAPAGVVPLGATFSPDGSTLLVSLHEAAGSSTGLATVPSTGGTLTSVPGAATLTDGAWLSATTLVAAGSLNTEGLFTIPAAGGTRAPFASSTSSGAPEVAPGGAVYYVFDNGTTSRIERSSGGTVETVVTADAGHWVRAPRISPDGQWLYYRDVDGGDPATSDDDTFTIRTVGTSGGTTYDTSIGFREDATFDGFHGYDVRQPLSKGLTSFYGDPKPETLAKDSAGTLWAYYSSDDALVAGRVSLGGGWGMFNAIYAPGDLTGDDRSDVLARKPDGTLWLYVGLGGTALKPGVQVGSGWSSYVVVTPGDFDGDGRADLLGRDSGYRLWLYPGIGGGRIGARTLLTSGWGGFNAILGAGDVNYDGRADFLGRETSTGRLYLYPGNGSGGIGARTLLGSGWNTITAFSTPEFLGTRPGLWGRRSTGTLYFYDIIGDGRFSSDFVYSGGGGWNGMTIVG